MVDQTVLKPTTVFPWATGVMLALIGMVALYVSSRAGGSPLYWIGLAIFGFSILAIFFLISRASDQG
jgi:hypothetical protein